MKNRILNIIFSSAIFFILLIFFTNVITVGGWLVKIPITKFHFILSFLVTVFVNYFIQKKVHNITKKDYLISIIINVLCLMVALGISMMFFDISYDGSWYHLTSIIKMGNGWNPIYEYINSGGFGDVYIDSYSCKSIWSFGATVYALFGSMDFTKIISTLMAFSVFFLSVSIFGKLTDEKWKLFLIVIFSFVIGFNPIYISQMFTNYIDSTLGLYTIFYVLLFINLLLGSVDFNKKLFCFLISICIALMANTKLTGLFFAAIFFLIFIIIYFIQKIKKKEFNKKLFFQVFFSGLFGLIFTLWIGINPFITNVVRDHNPFYPIIGSEYIEVMGANVPEAIRNKSNFEKILLINFAQTSNSTSIDDFRLQNPLTWNEDFKSIMQDTRVGAFGSFFSTIILLIGISILIFSKKIVNEKDKKNRNVFAISIAVIAVVALIFPESWWGRYYVILWCVPIFICLYYLLTKNKWMNIASIIIALIILLNVATCFIGIYQYNKTYSKSFTDYVESIKGKKIIYSTGENQEIKKWTFVLQEYFEKNDIDATVTNSSDMNWDFVNIKANIKILE